MIIIRSDVIMIIIRSDVMAALRCGGAAGVVFL